MRKASLIIFLSLMLLAAPSFPLREVGADTYNVRWSFVSWRGDLYAKVKVYYTSPDSVTPGESFEVSVSFTHVYDAEAFSSWFDVLDCRVYIRETPDGSNLAWSKEEGGYRLEVEESANVIFYLTAPDNFGTYYVVLKFKFYTKTTGGGRWMETLDIGEQGPEACPVLTVKRSCSISCQLSPSETSVGSSILIFGDLTPGRETAVTLRSRESGAETWEALATIYTSSSGSYSYEWTPTEPGTYHIEAYFPGDEEYCEATSSELTLTVEAGEVSPGIPGFPFEGIILGFVVAAITIFLMRKREIVTSTSIN